MSVVIAPTVGRKVWYRPSKSDQMGPVPMICAGDQPLDATVVAVWGDRCVNLVVFDANGNMFRVTSCVLLQHGDEPNKDSDGNIIGRYAEWMPYQTGQAIKHARADAEAVAVAQ